MVRFRKIIKCFVCSLFAFYAFSCSSLYTQIPYSVSGEMVLNQTGKKESSNLNFIFKNISEKKVFSFTLCFFLFDENGDSVLNGKPNITCIIRKDVEAGDVLEYSVGLDSYLFSIPEEPYSVEYLFVKKIVYEDGSEWCDPYGLLAL